MEVYRSMEDCRSIMAPQRCARADQLEDMIAMCAEQFIDRQNWTANFDSPEFAALLEYVSLFPKETLIEPWGGNVSWIADRQQMLEACYLKQVYSFQTYPYSKLRASREDSALPGFPGVEGNGAAFVVETAMGMWSGSAHKDDCWSFLRFLLLPETQASLVAEDVWYRSTSYNWMDVIPSNRHFCERVMEELSKDTHTSTFFQEGTREMSPWSEENTAFFWDYLSGVTVVYRREESIANIIEDEAERFFAGDQTAEAAAKAVQSRVNLYLGERKP